MTFVSWVMSLLRRRPFFIVGVMILVVLGGYYWLGFYGKGAKEQREVGKVEVTRPTIVNGELVLPKVGAASGSLSDGKIGVLSANLFGVFDPSAGSLRSDSGQAGQGPSAGLTPKLVGIRILGEIENRASGKIDGLSPVVRFLDQEGKVMGQKVGRLTPGFGFLGFMPQEKTVYDVMVEDPLQADKLEIIINSAPGEGGKFEPLKVAGRNIEVKTARYQGGQDASASGGPVGSEGEMTEATPPEIEYYTVSGQAENGLVDAVTEITVYAWVKGAGGEVFSFGRQDFGSDLVNPGEKVDFRINLVPFKADEIYDSYAVAVWGRRYKLLTGRG